MQRFRWHLNEFKQPWHSDSESVCPHLHCCYSGWHQSFIFYIKHRAVCPRQFIIFLLWEKQRDDSEERRQYRSQKDRTNTLFSSIICLYSSSLIYSILISISHPLITSLSIVFFSPIKLVQLCCCFLTLHPVLLLWEGVINHSCCTRVLLENDTYPFENTSSPIISSFNIFRIQRIRYEIRLSRCQWFMAL